MAYEHKPNSGTLFKSDRKTTDKHPDMSGKLNVDGRMFFIDAWDNGTRWSLRVKPMQQQNVAPQASPSVAPADSEHGSAVGPASAAPTKLPGGFEQMEDDIPFAPIGRGIGGHAI